MDTASEKRLASVHPKLAQRVRGVIERLAAENIEVRVVQGLRTYAEQNALYAQGRLRAGPKVTNAKGGFSNHNFGFACDLCPFENGKPQWNDAKGFDFIGRLAKLEGLEWGGDWPKPDRPHVQLSGMSIKECQVLYRKGGLPAVWKEMTARLLR